LKRDKILHLYRRQADQLMPLGGPVKFKRFDESLALVARKAVSVSLASSSSSEDEEDCTQAPSLCLCLLFPHQIPHPSVPPLFGQDRVILNT